MLSAPALLPPPQLSPAAAGYRRDCLEIAGVLSALVVPGAGDPVAVETGAARPDASGATSPVPLRPATARLALTAVGRALSGMDAPNLGHFFARWRVGKPGVVYARLRV